MQLANLSKLFDNKRFRKKFQTKTMFSSAIVLVISPLFTNSVVAEGITMTGYFFSIYEAVMGRSLAIPLTGIWAEVLHANRIHGSA